MHLPTPASRARCRILSLSPIITLTLAFVLMLVFTLKLTPTQASPETDWLGLLAACLVGLIAMLLTNKLMGDA